MEIKNSSLRQQVQDSKVSTPSLFNDLKNLFDKAIENPKAISFGNKSCSVEASCRGLKNFLDDYMPH